MTKCYYYKRYLVITFKYFLCSTINEKYLLRKVLRFHIIHITMKSSVFYLIIFYIFIFYFLFFVYLFSFIIVLVIHYAVLYRRSSCSVFVFVDILYICTWNVDGRFIQIGNLTNTREHISVQWNNEMKIYHYNNIKLHFCSYGYQEKTPFMDEPNKRFVYCFQLHPIVEGIGSSGTLLFRWVAYQRNTVLFDAAFSC